MHPSAQVSSPFNNIQIMGLVPSACQCPHRVWSPEKVPRISPQSPGSQSGMVSVRHPTPPSHLPPGCSLSWRPSSDAARGACVLGLSLAAPRDGGAQQSFGKIWGAGGSYGPGGRQRNPRTSVRGSFQVHWPFPPSGLPSGPLPLRGCRPPHAGICALPSKPGPLLSIPPSPVTVSEARTR